MDQDTVVVRVFNSMLNSPMSKVHHQASIEPDTQPCCFLLLDLCPCKSGQGVLIKL